MDKIKIHSRFFLKNYRYFLLALSIAFLIFAFSTLIPNWKLLVEIIFSEDIPLSGKSSVVLGLFGSIKTNFTLISATNIVLVSILFGVNISMFSYYKRALKISAGRASVAFGTGGLLSGILGIGCASCGTVILSWFLPAAWLGSIVSILPFGGAELGFAGVVLLLLSIFFLRRKIKATEAKIYAGIKSD